MNKKLKIKKIKRVKKMKIPAVALNTSPAESFFAPKKISLPPLKKNS
jgi:hypothetical protein